MQVGTTRQYVASLSKTDKIVKSPRVIINVNVNEPKSSARV
jgi:hypothetical protein